jgi:hypothetical protein
MAEFRCFVGARSPRHDALTGAGLVSSTTSIALAVVVVLRAAVAPAQTPLCPGDCDDDRIVAVNELVGGVNILLGAGSTDDCPALDVDGDDQVAIDEMVGAVASSIDGCAYPRDDELRLNHIQVVASHNSYHIAPLEPLRAELERRPPAILAVWDYTNPPLDEQFETRGVRAVEIDVFADPEGGKYADRGSIGALTGNPASGIPELDLPGLKVLHIQDIDFESTCWLFVDCLSTIKQWSDDHPGHAPIMIQIEAKDDELQIPGLGFEFVVPIPIGDAELDTIDAEIRSVFPIEQIITPDEVRGDRETLEEAILTDGWPTLAESRGRVLFTLDNGGGVKATYIAGHPSLRGRIMFTDSSPGEPEAAFVKLNDPVADAERIEDYVAQGFVVRTRADSDTQEGRTGDTTRRDIAIASGAQWVSTDFTVPDERFGTGYFVEMPDGMPARCNPISAPEACEALDIEDPDEL